MPRVVTVQGSNVRLKEVGVLLDESGGRLIPRPASEPGGDGESGDACGQGRGGVAPDLLPAVLLGGGAMLDQESGGAEDHRGGVEIAEDPVTAKAVGEKDRQRHFIQLEPPPVRPAVHPKVLGESPVGLLSGREVDERAERGLGLSHREEAGRGVAQIPDPDEVVATLVFVPLGGAPRDRERRDEGAREGLVLVGQEDGPTRMEERPPVLERNRFPGMRAPTPLR